MTRRATVMTRRLGGHQAVWRGQERAFSPPAFGEMLFWTAPLARSTITGEMTSLGFQLRSGAREVQRFNVRIAGETVDELQVWGRDWQRYVMRPGETASVIVEFATARECNPRNDFRAIGVGIDRTWASS